MWPFPLRNPVPVLVCVAVLGLPACAVDDAAPAQGSASLSVGLAAEGALIHMEMPSSVAVLLDEIPQGPQREKAAAEALAQSTAAWQARAQRQVRLTYYRLVFRASYYPSDWANASKSRGPLPLPPTGVWTIALQGAPRRVTTPQHDAVVTDYTFDTHILTDADSPGDVEPALASVGGVWDESFSLPLDPELLLERTGYACMDEDEYPAGSVFEENTWYFYDDYCTAKKAFDKGGCHLTQQPKESCVEALQKHTGVVKTAMHFTRVAWDKAIADKVRVGTISNPDGANLVVVTEGMVDEQRIHYRYFGDNACELAEGVIGKLGWRRLLMFSAIVRNDGTEKIHLGDVSDLANPFRISNAFEWSGCHAHYHFSHYGTFNYNGAPGAKRAFCLEDTNRFHNDEGTPLRAMYQSCHYQGMTAGWGDEYEFGIPGQWVDITDIDASTPHPLTFVSNPNAFLCEGKPILDAQGNFTFDATEWTDTLGNIVSRVRCAMPSTWQDDNVGSVQVAAQPGQGFVTQACDRGQLGPLRNCGFAAQKGLHACTPGSTVTLQCKSKTPQVLRVCERSEALGIGIPCTVGESAANQIVASAASQVSFTCPATRDSASGTGGYGLFAAPLLTSQASAAVTCTGY